MSETTTETVVGVVDETPVVEPKPKVSIHESAIKPLFDTLDASWEETQKNPEIGIDELDKELSELELASESIQKQLVECTNRMKLMRNRKLPLHSLPLEVFVSILFWTLDLSSWSMSQVQNLALVSKQWNEAVLSSPWFWPLISITNYSNVNNIVLKKNQNAPLAVNCIASSSYTTQECLDFLRPQVEHAHRWKALAYYGYHTDEINEILETRAPNVTDMMFNQYDSTATRMNINLCEGVPLRYLELSGASVSWSSSQRLKNLVSLRITNLSWNVPSLSQLYTFLSASPTLRRLFLWRLYPDSMAEVVDPERREINLPNLHTLILAEVPGRWMQRLAEDVVGAKEVKVFKMDRVNFSVLKKENFRDVITRPLSKANTVSLICDMTNSCIRIYSQSPHLCNSWMTETPDEQAFDLLVPIQGLSEENALEVWKQLGVITSKNENTEALTIDLQGDESYPNVRDGESPLFPHKAFLEFPHIRNITIRQSYCEVLSLLEFLSKPLPSNNPYEIKWPCPELTKLAIRVTDLHSRRQPIVDHLFDVIRKRHIASESTPASNGFVHDITLPKPLRRISVQSVLLDEFPNGPHFENIQLSQDM